MIFATLMIRFPTCSFRLKTSRCGLIPGNDDFVPDAASCRAGSAFRPRAGKSCPLLAASEGPASEASTRRVSGGLSPFTGVGPVFDYQAGGLARNPFAEVSL
jgi:hypothetical protein